MTGTGRRAVKDPPGRGRGPERHRGRMSVVGGCLILAAVPMALSGCSGGDPSKPTTAAADAPVTTTTPASPSTTSGSAATTPGSPAASTRAASAGPVTLPFVADVNPDVSSEHDGSPVLVSLAKGYHDGYVRYVFTFNHSDPDGHQPWRQFARPAWDVRYVSRDEAVQDGSGAPVVNVGANAHLKIRFDANMHDGAEGQNTLQSSVSDEDALAFGGDFEGRVTWFYGSEHQRPFRVIWVGDGRVAVDIVD